MDKEELKDSLNEQDQTDKPSSTEEKDEHVKVDDSVSKLEDVSQDQVDEQKANEDDELVQLKHKLEQLEQEKQSIEDRYLRAQAEIANMKRIHQREKQDAAKFRSQNLATELLEVIDNLERALTSQTTSEEAESLKKGVEMVLNQFKAAFEKEHIEVIDPLNQAFDPNYHQAVSMMPAEADQEADTVINVLQKGYVLNERVLRPAMVIVAQ
ncbi:nucleotide exchange factor GrpE [Vaginisenegalia massiliensis]|uniref:nucleotide exchange factor GrpE n=1 Tax=Vaginisenegalia massiliensis TaxID=2058294 RepID=UPI001F14C3D9|nr:nucleotide exchange factor GrpE [Vaginisenegalia massiliensis]